MTKQGVLLDLDNTLYDYETCHRAGMDAAAALALERCGIDRPSFERGYQQARREIHDALAGTAASHNRLLYFQRLLERERRSALPHALEVYGGYWEAFLAVMRLDAGAEEFLDAIASRPVCLVTDLTAHIQHRKIRRLGLERWVNRLVTSEEAGREKPDPEIFRLGLEKIGCNPAAACMIGDDYRKDILGAVGCGIRAFWINRSGERRDGHGLVTEVRGFADLTGWFHD